MSEEYLDGMQDEFNAVIAHFERGLVSIRTGRASPQMLENVKVHVASYGAQMPLNQLASISAPDARLLVLNPWDKSTISDIEKGIVAAGLGLNPSSDGQIVRVPIPALTADRRQDLIKKVGAEKENSATPSAFVVVSILGAPRCEMVTVAPTTASKYPCSSSPS